MPGAGTSHRKAPSSGRAAGARSGRRCRRRGRPRPSPARRGAARARSRRSSRRPRRRAGACAGCCCSGARARRSARRGTGCARGGPPARSCTSAGSTSPRIRTTTDDEGHPADARARRAGELRDGRDERGGQVVDDEPAEILERHGGLGATRPRQARDHEELTHILMVPTTSRVNAPSPRVRNSRRGIVAAAAYSARAGEEARGRRRFLHAVDHEARRRHRVDVPTSGRWMNGMKTSFSTSSIVAVLDEVWADAPVLLGRVEDLVVDPAAVRGLQQRMVEEEEEAAARSTSTRPTSARRGRRRRCARRRGRPPPRRTIADANGRSAAPARGVARRSTATASHSSCAHVGSTPATRLDRQLGRETAELSLATPDVEHATRARPSAPRPAEGSAPRTRGRRRR